MAGKLWNARIGIERSVGEPCQVIEVDAGIRGIGHDQIDQLQTGHMSAQSRDGEQFNACTQNRFHGPAGP